MQMLVQAVSRAVVHRRSNRRRRLLKLGGNDRIVGQNYFHICSVAVVEHEDSMNFCVGNESDHSISTSTEYSSWDSRVLTLKGSRRDNFSTHRTGISLNHKRHFWGGRRGRKNIAVRLFWRDGPYQYSGDIDSKCYHRLSIPP